MDELLSHCLREIAFDGDFGCDVSRLGSFIEEFYARRQQGSDPTQQNENQNQKQTVDDAFRAYVWTLISAQPNVRVGLVPPGVTTEVAIPPRAADKRNKNKNKNKDAPEPEEMPSLQIVAEAKTMGLPQLVAAHGANLRIAVDEMTSFKAITGSHIRPPKLSAMVYCSLQLICRGRELGMSLHTLAKTTGYDSKTCHYIASQLLSLDLIVKVPKPGVGANFCVHKYFVQHAPVWQRLHAEEADPMLGAVPNSNSNDHSLNLNDHSLNLNDHSLNLNDQSLNLNDHSLDANDGETSDAGGAEGVSVNWTFRMMNDVDYSSERLFRARVVALLKAMPRREILQTQLLLACGVRRDKTLRRFFMPRVEALINEGVIEQVNNPHPKKAHATRAYYRLVNAVEGDEDEDAAAGREGVNTSGAGEGVNTSGDSEGANTTEGVNLTEGGVDAGPSAAIPRGAGQDSGVVAVDVYAPLPLDKTIAGNVTLQKQMIDLLEEAGTKGMTLTEMKARLAEYDRRTLELMLYRLSSTPPPPHLADIGVKTVLESFKRERRYRYYTTLAYARILAREQLPPAPGDFTLAHAERMPDLAPVVPEDFYKDEEAYGVFVREHAGRPRGKPLPPGKSENPRDANGVKIKGRPRKEWAAPKPPKPKQLQAVKTEDGEDEKKEKAPPKKAVGRGRKRKREETEEDADGDADADADGDAEEFRPKKRGRPAKKKEPPVDAGDEEEPTPAPKRRGRPPRKAALAAAAANAEEAAEDPDKTDELQGEAVDTPVAAEKPQPKRRGRPPRKAAKAVEDTEKTDEIPDPVVDGVAPAEDGQAVVEVQLEERVAESTALTADAPTTDHQRISEVEGPSAPAADPPNVSASTPRVDDGNAEAAEDKMPVEGGVTIIPETPKEMVLVDPTAMSASTSKRPLPPDVEPAERKRKRYRADERDRPRAAVELSRLRRENEFIKLAELHGGFVCVSATKAFKQNYMKMTDEMLARGEAISGARGVAPDSKTTQKTLDALQAKGRVKVLETFMATPSGVQIKAKVYHLVDLPEDRVNRELAALSATLVAPVHGLGAEETPAPQADSSSTQLMDLRGSTNSKALLSELVTADGEAARGSFLTEKSTYWQIYGYLMGRYARARELHLFTLSQLAAEDGAPSRHFVSRKDRIVALAYFFNDLPLGTYCSLVSVPAYNEALEVALRTVEGMNTPMWCIPRELSAFLETGRHRARGQVTNLFNMLIGLDLVIPLSSATEDTAEIVVEPTPESIHPIYYKRYVQAKDAKLLTPMYYQFNTSAPMYHYGSKDFPPPFIGERSVLNADVSLSFWRELRTMALNPPMIDQVETSRPLKCPLEEFKRLKSPGSWVDYYVMTWYQKEYLRNHVNPATGETPLDDPDPQKAAFLQLCHISCVPIQVAQAFYAREKDDYLKARMRMEKRKAQSRKRVAQVLTGATDATEAAPAAAAEDESPTASQQMVKVKKTRRRDPATKARMRRESDWDEVLDTVHPEPMEDSLAEAMQLLKDHYLENAGLTKRKLQIEMRLTIDKHNQKVAQAALPTGVGHALSLVPLVASADTTPVQELVDIVRSKTEALGLSKKKAIPRSKRRKNQKVDNEEAADGEDQPSIGDDGRQRRRRFAWNAQFDELARDAGAILRVRCHGTRMDWSAIEHVFPGLSRVAVRTRIVNLRDAPGGESYFTRLDEAWRALWLAHRGSAELPDPNPNSTGDFPIVEHIEFLRRYLDKQALRMGVNLAAAAAAAAAAPDKEHSAHQQPLLRDVAEYMRIWNVEEKPRPAPAMREFMWAGLSDEQRERESLREPYTVDSFSPPAVAPQRSQDVPDEVVEAALKMMLSTSEEIYEEDLGVDMLKAFGDEASEQAAIALLERNVVSHTMYDREKLKPGRTLKIAEPHEAGLGGWLSADLALDAVALDDAVAGDAGADEDADEWREWSTQATDGDTAAFLRMVVNDEVDVDIDLPYYAAAREALDWNSRKVDDGQIEGVISWRCKRRPDPLHGQSQSASEMKIAVDSELDLDLEPTSDAHGLTAAKAPACCYAAVQDGVVVDCAKCLTASSKARLQAAPAEMVEDMKSVEAAVESAGWKGLTRGELVKHTPQRPESVLWAAVRRLTAGPVPLLLWTGYDNARLVHASLAGHWTVRLGCKSEEEHVRRVLPRRWVDIRGGVIDDVWNAAVRAVTGLVQLRPGITQADVRAKLSTFYDRQEVNAVLGHLVKSGVLRRELATGADVAESVWEVDVRDEKRVFWFTAGEKGKGWYWAAAESARD